MEEHEREGGSQAVRVASRLAQDAVVADNAGDVPTAVSLYSRAVELLAYGLERQQDGADTTVLQRYCTVYRDRIADLTAATGSGRSSGAGPLATLEEDDEEEEEDR